MIRFSWKRRAVHEEISRKARDGAYDEGLRAAVLGDVDRGREIAARIEGLSVKPHDLRGLTDDFPRFERPSVTAKELAEIAARTGFDAGLRDGRSLLSLAQRVPAATVDFASIGPTDEPVGL